MKSLSKMAVGFALAVGTPGAMGDMMRCGGAVIDDAALEPVTQGQVLAACGEPTSKGFGQWVYQQSGQFVKVLTFDSDGNLRSIREQPAGD